MFFIDLTKKNLGKYVINKKGKHLFFLFNQSGTIEIEIKTPKTEVYIFGLFIGKKNDNFQLETVQRHSTGESFSNLFIKGIFFDESRFIYEGLIRTDKDAQKTHAYQKNQNLIMGEKCFVDSRPFLEILANDVFCTHGSTTGRLNKEQLYYLETRGLPPKKAEHILITGFINDLFGKIEELGYRQKISHIKNQIAKQYV
ncbi:MAG TPA: SufD family Fe-S cluster assembly protein [Patescibacteria group bacterium]|nr:SufD family Fe-S cluster assembly protein [Patescibacteria group bacterium]